MDLIDRDPARRVRLKIGQERLAKLHPSDIADILEDLAPAEREALFSSLPEETAAETLEEIEPKLQKALLQGLDSERAADILEEMDPGAAADVLGELSEEESEAILEEMEPEERQDVEELLEFSADTAAGLMTTDYVSALKDGTAADAVRALREFEGDPDTITEIYLLGDHEKLAGDCDAAEAACWRRRRRSWPRWPTSTSAAAGCTRATRRWPSCSISTTCARCRWWMSRGTSLERSTQSR